VVERRPAQGWVEIQPPSGGPGRAAVMEPAAGGTAYTTWALSPPPTSRAMSGCAWTRPPRRRAVHQVVAAAADDGGVGAAHDVGVGRPGVSNLLVAVAVHGQNKDAYSRCAAERAGKRGHSNPTRPMPVARYAAMAARQGTLAP
jgi:hypothetical protein